MHFKMSCAICFNLDQSKISPSSNGLNVEWSMNMHAENSPKAEHASNIPDDPGLCSPTFPKNVLRLVLQTFLYLATFKCNTTIYPISSCVTFKFTKSWRNRQRMFLRIVGEHEPLSYMQTKWIKIWCSLLVSPLLQWQTKALYLDTKKYL